MKILQGQRPDVTPAQLIGVFTAGVPVIANLLQAFGVYDLTVAQQDALTKTVGWGAIMAIGLFGADFGLRAVRNHADATVRSAALMAPTGPPPPAAAATAAPPSPASMYTTAPPNGGGGPVGFQPAPAYVNGNGFDDRMAFDEDLPSDEEEFAGGGPDDDPGPESRIMPVAVEGQI